MGPKGKNKQNGDQLWDYGFWIMLIQLIILKVTEVI